jgi:hypothetical protein
LDLQFGEISNDQDFDGNYYKLQRIMAHPISVRKMEAHSTSADIAKKSRCLRISGNNGKYVGWMWMHFLLVLLLSTTATSMSVVETLPGYSDQLPFNLETG